MKNAENDVSVTSTTRLLMSEIERRNCYHLIVAAEKQVIHFWNKNTQYVYLLRTGEVEIRRISDNMVISCLKPPSAIGLTLRSEQDTYHYIKTSAPAELMAVRKEVIFDVFDTCELWREAFTLCVDVANKAFERDEACASRNVYSIVRQHLEMIWVMDEQQRNSTSVFEFILDRANISRSSLNKIIKDLSVGGYIKTYRGKLLDKKNLPMNY